MNRVLVAVLLASVTIVGFGCASKKYVRQQMESVNNKLAQLDTSTTENTNQIKDLNAHAQQAQSMQAGIDQANQKAADAAAQAQQAQDLAKNADSKASSAESKASSAESKATDLGTQVANLETQPRQLPKTGSQVPSIGLLGMLCLAASFGLRALR